MLFILISKAIKAIHSFSFEITAIDFSFDNNTFLFFIEWKILKYGVEYIL